MKKEKMKWYSRMHLWCGLPWTFTKYGMSEDRLFVEKGLLNTSEQEVRLYRIMNKDLSCFDIINVKNSEEVKEMISDQVERERVRNRVSAREFMSDHEEQGEDDALFDPDDDREDH